MKNKNIIVVTLLIALVSGSYFFINTRSDNEKSLTPAEDKAEIVKAAKPAVNTQVEKAEPEEDNIEVSTTEDSVDIFSEESINRRYEWFSSHHGLYAMEAQAYRSYSTEALEKLAFEGDPIALYILPTRLMQDYNKKGGGDWEKLCKDHDLVLIDAAVRGSSYALLVLGNTFRERIFEEKSMEAKRRLQQNAMAYYKVALKRGYKQVLSQISSLKNDLGSEQFTGVEIEEIESLSDKIYNSMVMHREKMDLPPFDNEIPDFIVPYYDYLEEEYGG